MEDGGWYTCLAGNAIGISHRSAWLTVVHSPNTSAVKSEELADKYHIVIIAVTVGVTCIIIFCVLLCCVFHRLSKPEPKNTPPLRKRVVLMRPNILYPDYKGQNSGSSLTPLVPQVKIEGGRNRLSSELTAVSEYEIPLDKEWEFSRDK